MSKSKRIDLGALDRVTIAREVGDGPAEDGYLCAKAQDPRYLRDNYACYMANGEHTDFVFDNHHCAPHWAALAVCSDALPEDFDITFEVHGSNDDFATFEVLATLRWVAGTDDFVVFNMEKACVGYKKIMVHAEGAAGLEFMAHLTAVKIMGC